MSAPTFEEFYAAVQQRQPFPWQCRLAASVLEHGWANRVLDLPTGTGKTSILDIALYCLARAPLRMPRRTVLVVDRRIVVDQGADHARSLRRTLDSAAKGPAKYIADALRSMCGAQRDEPSLAVAVMRGGMPRDNDWARRPDQPILGVSTVDQIGSRLLFRGYGVSARSASIHAGLIGNDTLIVLDEVHLAVPFARTLDAVRKRFRTSHERLPDRFEVVTMSATVTGPSKGVQRMALDAADRSHPVLSRRLAATKAAQLVEVKVTGDDETNKRRILAARAIDEAATLEKKGARVVGIVVNRVETARIALAIARERLADATDAVLVTGRMRPIDRDRVVRDQLIPRAGAGRTRAGTDRPLIVVATQCIEAGADLDFDGLVTEVASLDALRQRFGRVDRRGELGTTSSVVLARSDLVKDEAVDPVYGASLARTWSWLLSIAAGKTVDFGITQLPAAVDATGEPMTDLVAPSPDAPVMLPAHLDAWAQTSIDVTPDPAVAMWLHGPERGAADVQIIWRAIAPGSDLLDLVELLEAARPSALEAVSIPIRAAKEWLANQAVDDITDAGALPVEIGAGRDEAKAAVVLCWRGEDTEYIALDDIRPGDVLIVPTQRGGLVNDSFDPTSQTLVTDVGDLAQLRGRGLPTLRLDRAALAVWGLAPAVLDAVPEPAEGEILAEFAERARAWVASWPDARPDLVTKEEWHALRSALSSSKARATCAGATVVLAGPRSRALHAEIDELITEDDDSSFRATEVTLTTHSSDVQSRAAEFARALGFGAEVVDDLALAGWLHDIGKADPRFQRWLVGGDEIRLALNPEPLAKSALPAGNAHQRRLARERAGYPRGYRHELLSFAMVRNNRQLLARAHDPDLVLHLVASHHGWCRPFAPPLDDPSDEEVVFAHGEVTLQATTRHRAARLDSSIPDRFWLLTERYGWWGLAWLEAVLRLADHRASEDREVSR